MKNLKVGAALLVSVAALATGQAHAKSRTAADTLAATTMLSDLVKLDSTNPPGDTRAIAKYLQDYFAKLGVKSEIVLAPNGKAAHFILRLKGDGSRKPVLIAAHSDVVPVDQSRWSVPAFGGIVKDGYVWGRGALDNKANLTTFSLAVARLVRNKVPLARDVILLAEADEEQGSFHTSWLEKEHWAQMDAEFALNEGGDTIWDAAHKVRQVGVSTVDKLTVTFRMTANGLTGHSSRPLKIDETANGQLIAAMTRLLAFKQPVRLSPTTRAQLETLAVSATPEVRAAIRSVLDLPPGPDLEAAADRLMALDPAGEVGVSGLLRDSLVITMIDSGVKANVIPPTASAVMNARLFPGADVDAFIADINRTIADPRVQLKVISAASEQDPVAYYRGRATVPASSIDTDLYRAIQSAAAKQWPGARVSPMLLTGTTDAVPWREHRIPVYGIGSTPILKAERATVHGDDERVSVEALGQGVDFIYDILTDVAKQR
ncbi:M20/M25/M40 family metallo-hydrolase [Novosphingobium sp. AP12]|uniref:M20/M25/M40 family metallo-hydrolase n=1 Tax=Novosphingobium sp. AP12 TaxID=1144305 RepID=UPI000271F1AC|nr:M20/M25/M40 family metallo-hydrolase [Novosphingobium sp. AP12]EJL24219.1 acetylornithine deacetylase/succinyldiaminopimelate desuccinylase-like deacylase [Novosphingobium sp. AP12]